MDERISGVSIPQEVLLRYGGITNIQKEYLYGEFQSLDFVYIPSFLRSQISSIDSLYRYGICQSHKVIYNESYEYFVCPSVLHTKSSSFDNELRFCCGVPPQQYCCSSSQFTSGIHVIRSDLLISPSIVIGVSIGFLLLAVFMIIYTYSKLAYGFRQRSSKLFHETNCVSYGPNIPRQLLHSSELPLSSDLESIEPPKKVLLSSSRLTKVFPENTNNESLSQNVNNALLIPYNNSESERIVLISNKLNSSRKVNANSTPVKARPVIRKKR
uniref:Shisa N-terminal domain-containing protein n=1 Tax=Trichobilharzia regenti TaxID=157069 RepID=A0AA85JDF2_TRIRE|nr:unnamed protein product [Trichobilharzia regenti]